MATSNASSSSPSLDMNNCSLSNDFWNAAANARTARINVVMPFYIVAGFFGHAIFIIAVYRQARKDRAFVYQLFSLISETVEIVTFALYIFSRQFSGVAGPGYQWYWTNPVLMWFTAYLAIPLSNANIMLTLFLSVSAAADRVFVLVKPALYQQIDHRRHQYSAILISCVLSAALNAYHALMYRMDVDPKKAGKYVILSNDKFVAADLGAFLAFFSNVVRLVSVITLIVCNVIIVIRYRKRFKNVASIATVNVVTATYENGIKITRDNNNKNENKNEIQRKTAEKTLLLLTCCESLCTASYTLANVVFNMFIYAVPRFNNCEAFLFGPIVNCILMITSTFDFYAAIIVSRQFRTMVKNVVTMKDPTTKTTNVHSRSQQVRDPSMISKNNNNNIMTKVANNAVMTTGHA